MGSTTGKGGFCWGARDIWGVDTTNEVTSDLDFEKQQDGSLSKGAAKLDDVSSLPSTPGMIELVA